MYNELGGRQAGLAGSQELEEGPGGSEGGWEGGEGGRDVDTIVRKGAKEGRAVPTQSGRTCSFVQDS